MYLLYCASNERQQKLALEFGLSLNYFLEKKNHCVNISLKRYCSPEWHDTCLTKFLSFDRINWKHFWKRGRQIKQRISWKGNGNGSCLLSLANVDANLSTSPPPFSLLLDFALHQLKETYIWLNLCIYTFMDNELTQIIMLIEIYDDIKEVGVDNKID